MISNRDLRTDPFFRSARVGTLRLDATLTGRFSSPVSEPLRRLRIEVEADGSAPPWLNGVILKLDAIARLPNGWDSYGAPAIEIAAIARTIDTINEVMMEFDGINPSVVPTAHGGVQIEFHTDLEDLEITIAGSVVTASYEERQRGIQWDSDLRQVRDELREILKRMSG
jgi:hypothetical protein